MSLSNPRAIFGVHSVTPVNRETGLFYGTVKVLKSSSLALTGEIVELTGGSAKYPWAVESGPIAAEMSLKFAEYADFLFELFLGNSVTSHAAETTGSASALTNKKGTSVMKSTTGIASVGVKSGSHADLKFGRYVVKAVNATTVDVYLSTDADIARGADGSFQNDLLKITASPLTITASTPVTIPNFGLELTGGSGTIGMIADDTATFTVRPPNAGSTTVKIGAAANSTFPEFGCVIMASKRGNQELVEIYAYRCMSSGMPFGFDQNAWSEAEVKVKVFYDSDADGVFEFTHVKPA